MYRGFSKGGWFMMLVSLCLLLVVSLCVNNGEINNKGESIPSASNDTYESVQIYILNTRSKKIHTCDCGTAALIDDCNRATHVGNTHLLLEDGYTFCKKCFKQKSD